VIAARHGALLMAAILGGCGSAGTAGPVAVPVTVAPVAAPAAPAAPLASLVSIDIPGKDAATMTLVDGGRAALIGRDGWLTLVDLDGHAVVGTAALDSLRAKSPWPAPRDRERYRDVRDAVWHWDDATRRLTGAMTVASWQAIPDRGFARWRPVDEPLPTAMARDPKHFATAPIAISPDGGVVVARHGYASAIQSFDLATGAAITAPLDIEVGAVAFAADGRQLAVANFEGGVRLYDPARGVARELPDRHGSRVTALAYHPTQPRLATSDSETVRVWDLGREAPTATVLDRHGSELAWSGDGAYLAVAASDAISLLDGATLAPVGELPRPATPGTIEHLAFTADGRRLVAAGGGRLLVYDFGPRRSEPSLDAAWFRQLRRLPTPDFDPQPAIERTGVIRGRVTAGGRPVAGAVIELTPHHQEWPAARALGPFRIRTGADGRFLHTAVPRIQWDVTVTAPRLQRHGQMFVLRERVEETLDARLEPAATVVGIVRIPDGRSAAGAVVTVAERGPTVIAGRDGRFAIDHVRPGSRLQLYARSADGAVATVRLDVPAAKPTPVELRLLAADGPDVVRILVVDRFGAAVAGAQMTRDHDRGVSDAHGRWTVPFDPQYPTTRVGACRTHCTKGETTGRPSRLLILTMPTPPDDD
jgi:hypothetical protein